MLPHDMLNEEHDKDKKNLQIYKAAPGAEANLPWGAQRRRGGGWITKPRGVIHVTNNGD